MRKRIVGVAICLGLLALLLGFGLSRGFGGSQWGEPDFRPALIGGDGESTQSSEPDLWSGGEERTPPLALVPAPEVSAPTPESEPAASESAADSSFEVRPPLTEQERESFERRIAELADDDLISNAVYALRYLRGKKRALGLLEEALSSEDYQQRQLAGWLIRHSSRKPSDLLLEVSVEGLGVDELSYRQTVPNRENALRYLEKHTRKARPHLVRSLDDPDAQRSLLSAYLLGRAGDDTAVAKTAEILIDHLEDNDVRNDACLACQGLFGLGDAAVPYLKKWRNSSDSQQRALVELLYLNITDPTIDPDEIERRRGLVRITSLDLDPTLARRRRLPPDFGDYKLRQRISHMYYDSKVHALKLLRAEYGYRLEVREEVRTFESQQLVFGIRDGRELQRLLTLQIREDGSVYRYANGKWVYDSDL